MKVRIYTSTTLTIASGTEPALPLWQLAPTRDSAGVRLTDFMLLIPRLRTRAPLGRRLQGVARTAFAAGPAGTRRSFFVELQYWHLPQFELALQYGPEWIGDAALPALDADLTADGSQSDRFRLHFRGWF